MNLPDVTWPVSFAPVCSDLAPFALAGGLPVGGIYSGPGVDLLGNFNPGNVPLGQTILTYTYTNNAGCSASFTNTIDVKQCIDCGPCFSPGLNQANNGDFEKIVLLVLQAIERSLNLYIQIIPNQYEIYEPISSIVNEPEVPYGAEYIGLLARTGKIDAYKEGRNWVTSKKALLKYME